MATPTIVAVSIAYGLLDEPHTFLSGDCFLVYSQEELKKATAGLAERFLRDGFEIRNQLFIEIPHEMVQAAAKKLDEEE